jgi:hypothetical protein
MNEITYKTPKKLLSIGNDAKTVKGEQVGIKTAILYLAPANLANKKVNLCPNASEGCKAACLFTAGRAKFKNVVAARINKTNYFIEGNKEFLKQLEKEIKLFAYECELDGMIPAVRLNGTSDIAWERLIDFSSFPTVNFYDYTKSEERMISYLKGKFSSNYSLTFSKSECNDKAVSNVLLAGGNVAAVFGEVPTHYLGYPVIDGDKNDARFTDPKNVIIGLKAKGDAKKDSSGFVVKGAA